MQIRPSSLQALAAARGEVAVAVQPRLAGRVDAGTQRRMNAFAGRALTAPLLHAEQNHRSQRLARLNRALSAGIVDGLQLAFFEADSAALETVDDAPPAALDLRAPRRLLLDAGLALDAAGEELPVPQPLQFDALALPVVAPPWLLDGDAPPPRPPLADGSVLEARAVGASLRSLLAAGRALPRVGIVLLQAIEHWQVEGADPFDQCERDLEAEAFEDQQRRDAGRLLFYAWPDEWIAPLAQDVAWRNRLAHRLFEREAQLGAAEAMPWLAHGVPLALVAFNAAWQPLFADRAAVARAGGKPRGSALLRAAGDERDAAQRRIAGAGNRFLWQARIEQLAEHLAEARLAGADVPALSRQLRLLPPAGLLPTEALDTRARINRFFPSTLDVFAAPVPTEQLDLLLEEAAGLAPIDLTVRDRIALYVPVPQAVFEPDLLVLERPDPTGEIGDALGRFVDARADWLRRRQNLRVKGRVLQLGLDGSERTPPLTAPADDPLRLEDEALAPAVPAPEGLLHVSALAAGIHQHYVDRAAPLAVPAAATLYAWVLIDREHPPQQLMLQFFVDGWEHRAYWGASLIGWGNEGTASRLRHSEALPPPGVWARLVVDAAALALAGRRITGMAFTLHGGRACFGPAGLLAGNAESPWLTQALLDGGRLQGDGEAWQIVAASDRDAPFEAAFGTQDDDGAPASADLATLLADADLQALKIIPPGTERAAAPTLAGRVQSQGLRAAVEDLAARIDEADDVLNLGFLRVQTDLYRLRQSVLKQTQATRFAVSPALTQIADLDNATATREQLADFYADLRTGAQPLKRESGSGTQLQPRPLRSSAPLQREGPVPAPAPRPRDAPMAMGVRPGVFTNTAPSTRFDRPVSSAGIVNVSPAPSVFAPAAAPAAVEFVRPGTRLDITDTLGSEAVFVRPGVGGSLQPAAPAEPPSSQVTGADALTGKVEIRTSSIASRLERPRSIEAKDFSVATRADLIAQLAALGLDMDGLDVPGLVAKEEGGATQFDTVTGQPRRTVVAKLGTLRASQFAAVLADPDPRDDKADESAFFYSGVDLSDSSIALLRGAEGIVRRYRDALQKMRDALTDLEADHKALQARLAVVGRELAEARQDVATARALLAEEVARAEALNARRDAVVAEHVKFLAFARVRVAARALAVPARPLDSALEPDAVPACLAEHGEPPEDLRAMLALLRQAPLQWFPGARTVLLRLDQSALAERLIGALPLRAPSAPAFVAALPAQQAALRALGAQGLSVAAARQSALPLLQAAAAPAAPLSTRLQALAQAASLVDLLGAAAAERSELSRRAAEEFERIEAVASCLHAQLSGVRAAIRLQWAEAYSQFDAARGALDLGDLALLPRFGELRREQRQDIQELAAWLRRRVDADEPRAVALMADVVRVCVLAASHSPAGEIVTGRIVRPLPLNPGLRLEVRPLLPDRVRLGMQVQFFDAQQVAARAVVEDLTGGVASVRITQTKVANLATSLATAVHFVNR